MTKLKKVAPAEIEKRSFEIIEQEFLEQTGIALDSLDSNRFQVMRRVIHATGDFSYAHSLMFSPGCFEAGLEAIRAGRDIYVDVSMGASGISKAMLAKFGGSVTCHINDQDVLAQARSRGKTRSETALEKAAAENVGIVVVGNAPTALVAAMDLAERGKLKPALIVGVPVGFVNAEESKEILARQPYPFITNSGRKGGTPAAVAIVNALLRLA